MCMFGYPNPYDYQSQYCYLLEIDRKPIQCNDCSKCTFYKHPKDFFAGQLKAYERLATLPKLKQQQIADTYYNGQMPWHNESRIATLKNYLERA